MPPWCVAGASSPGPGGRVSPDSGRPSSPDVHSPLAPGQGLGTGHATATNVALEDNPGVTGHLTAMVSPQKDLRMLFRDPNPTETRNARERTIIDTGDCAHAEGRVSAWAVRWWRPQILDHGTSPIAGPTALSKAIPHQNQAPQTDELWGPHPGPSSPQEVLGFLPLTAILQLLT
jgi:hypothetical protein